MENDKVHQKVENILSEVVTPAVILSVHENQLVDQEKIEEAQAWMLWARWSGGTN